MVSREKRDSFKKIFIYFAFSGKGKWQEKKTLFFLTPFGGNGDRLGFFSFSLKFERDAGEGNRTVEKEKKNGAQRP